MKNLLACSLLCIVCAPQSRAQAASAAAPYLLFSPYRSNESLIYRDGAAIEEIRDNGVDILVTEPEVVTASSIVCVQIVVRNEGGTPFDINPAWISALPSANSDQALDFMAPDRAAGELNQLGLSARAPLEANTLQPGESAQGWVYFRVPPGLKRSASMELLLVPGNREVFAFRWPWPEKPEVGDDPQKPPNMMSPLR